MPSPLICFVKVGALAVSGQREDENPHDGELTFLGRVLAQLPVNQQLGKLIVLGHVFGCLDECLIIGECEDGHVLGGLCDGSL
jgi:ATP-dependent RNA helicase TDRD9